MPGYSRIPTKIPFGSLASKAETLPAWPLPACKTTIRLVQRSDPSLEDRIPNSPEFIRLARGNEHTNLATIALEIARDAYPQLNPASVLSQLERWAQRVRGRCPEGARDRHILAQINRVLYEEERLRGDFDDYYNPRNSYLNDVLERRLGIPISLSIIHMEVAERVGLAMAGVNLPGHFVIRTGLGPSTLFIDPFHQGTILDRSECALRVKESTGEDVALDEEQLAPAANSVVIARMLRNLKAVYLKQAQFEQALPCLRRLVLLTRGEVVERRDLGAACVHAGAPGEAIDHLEAYLAARPDAHDAAKVGGLLKAARNRLARWN